jgi:Tfp pilus assembly protein PilO
MNEKIAAKISVNTEQLKDFLLNFIVPVICLGGIALLGGFVLYPAYKSLPALTATLKEKSDLTTQLEDKYANLKKLVDHKDVVDQDLVLFKKLLSEQSLVPELLTQIDTIAKESGLTVTKMSYSFSEAPITAQPAATGTPGAASAQTPKSFKVVDVSMVAEGNYDQLVAFMANIEKSGRLLDVGNFRDSVSDKDGVSVLEFSFSLKSPYLFVQSTAVTDDPIELNLSDTAFTATVEKLTKFKIYETTQSSSMPTE